jgi:hypothetical protein
MDKKQLLEEYMQSVKSLNKMTDSLRKVGIVFNDDLIATIYKPTDYAAKAIEELINPNGFDWIEWFIWENNFGESGLDAGFDGKTKPIKNVDDLWELMNNE